MARGVSRETLSHARELRKPMTPPEQALWTQLRLLRDRGLRFRRQHPIEPFIVDFYHAATRTVIELDGDSHVEQAAYDHARTGELAARGYRVVRFANRDVSGNLEGVIQVILAVIESGRDPRDEP